MKNIIAIIWDFDKTLINGYMQDPIFQDYNVNAHEFWTEVNALPKKYMKEQHVKAKELWRTSELLCWNSCDIQTYEGDVEK